MGPLDQMARTAAHAVGNTHAEKIRYTTSIRTPGGRILVHVTEDALKKLGASCAASELKTLASHMQRLHDLALQIAAQSAECEVHISAAEIWWVPGQ